MGFPVRGSVIVVGIQRARDVTGPEQTAVLPDRKGQANAKVFEQFPVEAEDQFVRVGLFQVRVDRRPGPAEDADKGSLFALLELLVPVQVIPDMPFTAEGIRIHGVWDGRRDRVVAINL
jgi:hypothetical protein